MDVTAMFMFLQLRKRKKKPLHKKWTFCHSCLSSCNQRKTRKTNLSLSSGSGMCQVMCDAAEAPPQPWLEGVINKAEVLLPPSWPQFPPGRPLPSFVSSDSMCRATSTLISVAFYFTWPKTLFPSSMGLLLHFRSKKSKKGEAEPQREEWVGNSLQGLSRFQVQSCTTLPMVLFFHGNTCHHKQTGKYQRPLFQRLLLFLNLSINICKGQLPRHCISILL